MSKIYISGPMTGCPNLNYEAFDKARDHFLSLGHEVVSPADLGRQYGEVSYEECLKRDISALLTCDTIYLLLGWEDSFGARIESLLAHALRLKISYETPILD